MAIVEEDIERVRSAVSLVDIVLPYVQLKRVGRNHVGLCPFHAERSGSFNVRDEIGRYHCFGCGASGDVFRFVQEMEHVDFVTAVEQLAGKAGVTLHYTSGGEGRDRQRRKGLIEAMEAAVEWYHQRLLTGPDAPGGAGLPAQSGDRRRHRPTVPARLGPGRLGRPGHRPEAARAGAQGHRAGLPEPARPPAGHLPRSAAVPHLQRGRRAGGLRRPGPARQHGSGQVQELARDRHLQQVQGAVRA